MHRPAEAPLAAFHRLARWRRSEAVADASGSSRRWRAIVRWRVCGFGFRQRTCLAHDVDHGAQAGDLPLRYDTSHFRGPGQPPFKGRQPSAGVPRQRRTGVWTEDECRDQVGRGVEGKDRHIGAWQAGRLHEPLAQRLRRIEVGRQREDGASRRADAPQTLQRPRLCRHPVTGGRDARLCGRDRRAPRCGRWPRTTPPRRRRHRVRCRWSRGASARSGPAGRIARCHRGTRGRSPARRRGSAGRSPVRPGARPTAPGRSSRRRSVRRGPHRRLQQRPNRREVGLDGGDGVRQVHQVRGQAPLPGVDLHDQGCDRARSQFLGCLRGIEQVQQRRQSLDVSIGIQI